MIFEMGEKEVNLAKNCTLSSIHLAALLVLFVVGVAKADSLPGMYQRPAPGRFGYVFMARLSDLCPKSASRPLLDLLERKFVKSESELGQQLKIYPNSTAVIAGYLQASSALPEPTAVETDVQQLNQIPEYKLADTQRFTLATALYYLWSINYASHFGSRPMKTQELLNNLWIENHDPVTGLMLAEVSRFCGIATSTSLKVESSDQIEDQLIEQYGGPTVAADYDRAEADHWRGLPPGSEGVPPKNRRILLAMVCSVGSLFNSRTGTLKVIDGKRVNVLDNLTPDQIAGQKYFNKWWVELNDALGHKVKPPLYHF
jgi:hypothetical protein